MEEQQGFNKSGNHPQGCYCYNCNDGGMHFRRHRLLRWLLGILALVIVFSVGVKVGEVKQMWREVFGGYGRFGGHDRMMFRGDNMMYGGPATYRVQTYTPPVQSTPATTTPGIKK